MTGPRREILSFGLLAAILCAAAGCTSYRGALPPSAIRPSYADAPRAKQAPINIIHLRQEPPAQYLLGPRDVLGIYVEGVLGRVDDAPPVHFSELPNVPPSLGYPIPVSENGTISLPLLAPMKVAGLPVDEVDRMIRKAYIIDEKILRPDHSRIVVTLMRPRTYSALVVREDGRGGSASGTDPQRQATTKMVQLPAYENDVLHALVESGGLPGLDSKNEILILRGGMAELQKKPLALQEADPLLRNLVAENRLNMVRIPLRLGPNDPVMSINPGDIILNTGDVVYIQSRQAEVFYTGGLLRAAQVPLPRDYDLDVVAAVALAGGSIAATPTSSGQGSHGAGVGTICPPTRIIVTREIDGETRLIKISLKDALKDSRQRILIQPNDLLTLEYTEWEAMVNTVISTFTFNVSVNQLFQR